jgi:hypothetical protein
LSEVAQQESTGSARFSQWAAGWRGFGRATDLRIRERGVARCPLGGGERVEMAPASS